MRPESPYISPKRDFHFVRPAVILTTVLMLFSGCVGTFVSSLAQRGPKDWTRDWPVGYHGPTTGVWAGENYLLSAVFTLLSMAARKMLRST